VGEKDHSHGRPVNRTSAEGRQEERIGDAYRGYAASARKRRAWDPGNPGNVAIRAEVAEHVQRLAGARLRGGGAILDVGCGTGWWLDWLAGEGVGTERLNGLDFLLERVAAARHRVPGAEIVEGDARYLPFESSRFSIVLLFTVLSSLPGAGDVALALAEARRVTAPDGLLLAWDAAVPNPFNRATRNVPKREFERAWGADLTAIRLTLLPALARRLGTRAPQLYPVLARLPPLRTHRLVAAIR
jgi:ubiquinone/menaquinone biosynthesis C-methylase UbiE